jgi:RNA polymerase sigma factor (sigma-70 family)
MMRVGGDSPGREYERYRRPVLGMLAKRFPRLAEDDRQAIYQDAWVRVLAKRRRGEKIESLRAYLLATAGAEALHLVSRARIPSPIGPDDPRVAGLSDDAPPLDEQVVTQDQARIARNLLDTLDERQRDVLKLRWDLQLSGSEIRAALDLSERQYRRLAEEGATAVAERVAEFQNGQWSRRTRSLLVACLVEVTHDGQTRVGIASRRQREEAKRLLESDPHVAALFAEVRRSIRGAAALLPLPVLAGLDGGPAARLLEQATEVRDQLADTVGAAKQHATSLYLRAADPQLLAGGPRPGTAIVAVAGVLAVGGGAYGAHQVTSAPTATPAAAATPRPLVALPAEHLPTSVPKLQVPAPKRARPAAKPAPAQPTPPSQTTAQASAPTPSPQPPATQSAQPREFGFED